MYVRYKNGADGVDAVAHVYSREEHRLDVSLIDRDAVRIIQKLSDSGFESYIVGGAVRDLMLGRIPKDFDIATQASPRQVHRLFYNSRIIGRRFKIVHIPFGSKIIEVSTFRSIKDHTEELGNPDNDYGTIEEDAKRRDFSINSLYYNPIDQTVIDFNNAMEDFRKKRIRSLIPLNRTFIEDPVRMIRAIKCSKTTGFTLSFRVRHAIRKFAPELAKVSSSRMTDEVNKILASGCSCRIFNELNKYKLLVYMLPCFSVYARFPEVFQSLERLDSRIEKSKTDSSAKCPSKAEMYMALVQPLITRNEDLLNPNEMFSDIFRQMKVLLSPITPPNYELESACLLYMKTNNLKAPKNAVKHKPPQERQQYQRKKSHHKAKKPATAGN